jgi:hypothetical protein
MSGGTFWLGIFLLFLLPPVGAILLVHSLVWLFLSPWLLHVIYLGKFWGTQGSFFAFEGYMDLNTIEKQIFGARLNRMRWTPYGSPLSRHHKNGHGDCVSDDPTSDPAVAALVEKAKHAKPGDQRIFTLIDTGKYTLLSYGFVKVILTFVLGNMSVTLFQAARPPVCFVLAGAEGGMQRAIGCSYDWTTASLYRETVLRMPTPIQDRMDRVGRMKIGFKRSQHPVRPLSVVGEAEGMHRH